MLLLLLACSERFEADASRVDTGVEDTSTVDTDPDPDTASIDTDPDTGNDGPIELCINELMPDNESATADETGAYPDWFELHNPTEAAIDLTGWYVTDSRLDPRRHTLGALTLEPNGFLVLWADNQPDLGADHLGFALDNEGGEVAIYAPDGRGSIVTYGPMAADFSLARVPDCCEGDDCFTYDFRGSAGEPNVDPVYEDVALVPAGSSWKYWDQGTNPGDWASATFDDSAWPAGAGPLGYGDTHLVTTVGYGADANNKYLVTWFRLTFDLPARPLDGLTMGLLRDDGAVVYLNGTEIARDNLPEGDLTDATLASASVGGADETAYFTFTLDPTALRAGTNVLAVAVHQSAVTSSDLGFDLALTGKIEAEPE